MEQPYFMFEHHFIYLKEMTESKAFTKAEIRERFVWDFPDLTIFRVNKIFKYAETVLTF